MQCLGLMAEKLVNSAHFLRYGNDPECPALDWDGYQCRCEQALIVALSVHGMTEHLASTFDSRLRSGAGSAVIPILRPAPKATGRFLRQDRLSRSAAKLNEQIVRTLADTRTGGIKLAEAFEDVCGGGILLADIGPKQTIGWAVVNFDCVTD